MPVTGNCYAIQLMRFAKYWGYKSVALFWPDRRESEKERRAQHPRVGSERRVASERNGKNEWGPNRVPSSVGKSGERAGERRVAQGVPKVLYLSADAIS
jgi:hypothetical protein